MDKSQKNDFRCGFVSIVGRPNVGKSTLLNCILKEKVAIVSTIPQTTRTQIRGVYSEKRGQIIFIDTPGLHRPKDGLGKWMNRACEETLVDADCIIHLVDTSEPTGEEEDMVVARLNNVKTPVIIGLNKIDLKGKYVPEYIALWEKTKGKPMNAIDSLILLPISSKTGFNVDKLLEIIFEFLPIGEALYPQDALSDMPQGMAIADIVREKLFWAMRDEIPHSLAVIVEEMTKRKKDLLYLRINILVERESQKEIVIGKGGSVLKKVGTLARAELEKLMDARVFLDLNVKVEPNWRNNEILLQDMGYSSPG